MLKKADQLTRKRIDSKYPLLTQRPQGKTGWTNISRKRDKYLYGKKKIPTRTRPRNYTKYMLGLDKRLVQNREKLSDSIGAWKMSDEEARKVYSGLERHWKGSTRKIQGIDPEDPIFDIALGRRKPLGIRSKGLAAKRARKPSEQVDEAVYDEERPA